MHARHFSRRIADPIEVSIQHARQVLMQPRLGCHVMCSFDQESSKANHNSTFEGTYILRSLLANNQLLNQNTSINSNQIKSLKHISFDSAISQISNILELRIALPGCDSA